jgi:hypothetical protein
MSLRPFSLATLMRAIKVAEARFLEGRASGMNADTTYKSEYMEQMQREVRGVLAETVIGRRFNKYFFPAVNTFHKAADVGEDIEVRSTEYADGALILRDNDDPARRYVLVHVELNEQKDEPKMGFAVRGWCYGYEAIKDEWHKKGKGRPAWWYRGPLRPFETLTLERPKDAAMQPEYAW